MIQHIFPRMIPPNATAHARRPYHVTSESLSVSYPETRLMSKLSLFIKHIFNSWGLRYDSSESSLPTDKFLFRIESLTHSALQRNFSLLLIHSLRRKQRTFTGSTDSPTQSFHGRICLTLSEINSGIGFQLLISGSGPKSDAERTGTSDVWYQGSSNRSTTLNWLRLCDTVCRPKPSEKSFHSHHYHSWVIWMGRRIRLAVRKMLTSQGPASPIGRGET